MNLLGNSLRLWAQHREFRAILAELTARSDAELAELGLTRADIVRAAYEEAERRVAPPCIGRPSAGSMEAPLAKVGIYRRKAA